MIDMRKIQQDMPLLEHYIYLNTAAASAMPQPVVDEMTSYLQKQASIGPYLPSFRQETYAQVERIREKQHCSSAQQKRLPLCQTVQWRLIMSQVACNGNREMRS